MHVFPENAQNQGDRQEQQDSFGFSDHCDDGFLERAGFLALLADGMGGMAMGREAGDMAVQTLLEAYAVKSPEETVPEALRRAFHRANEAVWELGCRFGLQDSIGTTAMAAVVFEGKLFWAHAGDCRLYILRNDQLLQLSRDHNLCQRLVSQGVSEEVAASERQAEALTSFLGGREIPFLELASTPVELNPGDRILLCSDGLYRGLDAPELLRVLREESQDRAKALVTKVLERRISHQDNVTVLVLYVLDEHEPSEQDPAVGKVRSGSAGSGNFFSYLVRLWNKD